MLIVKPVTDKDEQRRLCGVFGAGYEDHLMAFLAVEGEPGEEKSGKLLGLCQISLRDGENEIRTLVRAPGTDDTEAMIIMARAAMNFMYRCEVHEVRISPSTDPALIRELGFRQRDGEYVIDLDEFYKSPCSYKK